MKRSIKPTRKRNGKRDLFTELTEGMDALADARTGKRMLRTHSGKFNPLASRLPFAIERSFAEEQEQRQR